MITDQNLLITGGAGSIGRALVSRFLDHDPNVIRIFDNNEPELARVKQEFDEEDDCRYLVGDIRDKNRLRRAMEDIDIVVHTAAMKHVDISEYNPFEAVKTNVVGLQHVIDAAIDRSVQKLVFTSSDKAVDPANTMGTTKLLGEKLIAAGSEYSGTTDLQLGSVRFGNVINSSQSVIPLFREQIRDGGPVTLTDRQMTRFFLTYDGIADLVSTAVKYATTGEVFVRKMSAIDIEDLATVMVQTLAPEFGHDPDTVDITVTGKRPGETLHEHTMTDREGKRALVRDDVYAIPPEPTNRESRQSEEPLSGFDPVDTIPQSSKHAESLSENEIRALLKDTITTETTE